MDMMNIFTGDAFSTVSMTAAVNLRPWQPAFLGSLGIFTPMPIRNIDAAVAINDEGALKIVPTTERGAPPLEQIVPQRAMRSFRTPRIAIGDTIKSHELQGMVSRAALSTAGGDFTALVTQDLQDEIAYRLEGPTGLRAKVEATKEHMRLGAISGVVLDADGSILYDWPSLFNVSLPAEIDFNLDDASPVPGVLLSAVTDLVRRILRAAKAGNNSGVSVVGLCGDQFFDALRSHPDVRNTYLNQAEASDLRIGRPFGSFIFGGVNWVNFRGTDDGSTIAIGTTKCKFIPVGVPGLFQEVLAPGESFDYVNTPGLPIYVMSIPDRDRNQWFRIETYSYPMYIATRPDVLFSARLT